MANARKPEELYPRAPRYTIEIGDNEIVRFAQSPRGAKTMHTRIINLSESGMAFLVPYLAAPQEQEKIKVEFTAPNSEPIACFARVSRIQIHKTYHSDRSPQSFKMVAVEFEGMHPKQREMLSLGLQRQFKKQYAQYQRQQMLFKFQWSLALLLRTFSRLLSRLFPSQSKDLKPLDEEGNPQSYIDV